MPTSRLLLAHKEGRATSGPPLRTRKGGLTVQKALPLLRGSSPMPTAPIFRGLFPGGHVWADPAREHAGDYLRLGFLDWRSLTLDLSPRCTAEQVALIRVEAAAYQRRRGEHQIISACGQSVVLGGGS